MNVNVGEVEFKTSSHSNLEKFNQNHEDKYRIIFVLGPPGAGKNTQCDLLIKKYNFVHFSCGDLLREASQKNDEEADLINEYIREGKIVPVQITCSLMKKAMDNSGGTRNTYIVDGFPRNKENLDGFLQVFADTCKVICVLYLECPFDKCTERINIRSQSSGRIDDNENSLKKRFSVFEGETLPNIKNLEDITKIIRTLACKDSYDVFRDITEKLDEVIESYLR